MQADTIIRRIEVPGAGGRAVRVRAGELVRVVDVEGGQVGERLKPMWMSRTSALNESAALLHAAWLARTVADPKAARTADAVA